MKRIIVLLVAAFFIAGAVAAFAEQPSGCAPKGGEKTVFQIAADTMAGKCHVAEKNRIKPIEKITVFQDLSEGIKKGSAEAKKESLRTK